MKNLTAKMKKALVALSDKKFKTVEELGVQWAVLHALKKRKLVESTTIRSGFPDVKVETKWRRLPDAVDNKWIKDFKEFVGKKTYIFDFKNFMKDYGLTVEQLSKTIGYTFDGTIKMLNRGTLKISTLDKLKAIYTQEKLNKYIMQKK